MLEFGNDQRSKSKQCTSVRTWVGSITERNAMWADHCMDLPRVI